MATYTDAFTDTNSVDLSAHTPTGGGFTWTRWTAISADYIDIQSNQANTTGSTAGSVYYTNITPSDADYFVQITIGASASASIGAVGRVNTGSVNFVSFSWTGSAWDLVEVISGVANSRDTDTSLSPSSTARTIKLVLNGTNARGFVDGTEVCSGTLTTVTATGVPGIAASASINRTADNWSFDDAITSDTTVTPAAGALSLTGVAPVITDSLVRARPASDITKNWSASTGTDHYALIDEVTASDTDYIYATAAAQTDEVKLQTMSAPNAGSSIAVKYRISGADGGGKITVSLYCNTTLIKADTQRTASGDYEMTVTSGEWASVADWSDMRLRFVSG